MPGRQRRIDPVTRDYVADDAGSYETTTTAETALYLQISVHRGKWWGDAEAGSRLHELAQAKLFANSTQQKIRDIVTEAVRPLLELGYVRDLQFRQERQGTRIVTAATATDAQSGERLTLAEILPFTG